MTCDEFRAMGGWIAAQKRRPTNAEIAAAYKHYAACESCMGFSDAKAAQATNAEQARADELTERALTDPESREEIVASHLDWEKRQ
jgi:predicted anti-sigma-YlaC factor YlaD